MKPSEAPTEDTLSPTVVAQELERIAASGCFRKAPRCLLLLRHVTTLTLEGRSGELKEYTLGVTVFERPESYDPRVDPIVRLEARRLRLKLSEYYQHEGQDDPVIIGLPKGAYVPDFRLRQLPDLPLAPAVVAAGIPKRRFPASLVAAGIVAAIYLATGFMPRKGTTGAGIRPSVAVLGFRDLSSPSENSWIGTAVTETMNIDLGLRHQLRMVPPDDVARMRAELKLDQSHAYSVADLPGVQRNLGADYVVMGTYSRKDDQVRVEVQLFNARDGKQIRSIVDQGAQANLAELVERCAAPIRIQLGSRAQPSEDLRSVSQFPASLEPAALESYARGMERLRQSDALGARAYLEKAVSEAPSSPMAHSALAAAWSMLGQDRKAQQEAKLALDAASGLGRLEQLEIEGRYRTIAHDFRRATQIYQAIFTLLPDDLESGLLLATVQGRGGDGQNALGTVAALRRLPSPLGDDPRIDLAEAAAAGAMSDFERTRKAAHAAAEKALKKGARLQYARARLLEAGAMQNLAVPGFSEARTEARGICTELGDRACVAAAFRIEANNLAGTGELSTARRLYQDVLETADQIGNSLERLNALNGLGYTSKMQGDLGSAEKNYRSALETASEMGPTKIASIELDLADVLLSRARISDAQALIAHALQVTQGAGEKEGIAAGLALWGHALALKGNLSEAQTKYTESIAVLREVNDPTELCLALLALGDIFIQQGNFAAARAKFEEAQTEAQRFPGGFADSEIRMAFARMNLEGGHFEQAETDARAALGLFARSGREGDRLIAAAVLARALVGEGKIEQASEAITQSPAVDTRDLPVWVPLELQIARGDCLAHSGKAAEAARMMDTVASEMLRLGLPALEKEAVTAKKAFLKVGLHNAVLR